MYQGPVSRKRIPGAESSSLQRWQENLRFVEVLGCQAHNFHLQDNMKSQGPLPAQERGTASGRQQVPPTTWEAA